jgi:hypothetical protein
MLLALDPNIVQAVVYDMDSIELLRYLGIAQDAPDLKVKIAADEFDTIRRAYQDYLLTHNREFPNLSHKFAKHILNRWQHWTESRQTDSLSPEIIQFIDDNGCTDELERCLIALAALYDDVFLSCFSHDAGVPDLQDRVILHNPDLIEQLRRIARSFLLYAPLEARVKLEDEFWSSLFEQKVADWISRNMRYPSEMIETSYYPPYLKQSQGAGEVDVLATNHISKPRRILVCECKLRLPGNEDKLISKEEIAQLVATFEVIKREKVPEYERSGYSVRVQALFVSNASGIMQGAKELAKSEKVWVRRAYLPDDWHLHTEWIIDRCERVR